jgi:hypothetical protein
MPLFAEIVAPSLAAVLMARSPWIPLIMGLSGFLVGPCLLIFVPETLHLRPRETESATLTPDTASERSVSTSDESDQQGFFTTITKQASNGLKEAYGSLSVLHSLPILLLLTPFLMQPLIAAIRRPIHPLRLQPLPLETPTSKLPALPPRIHQLRASPRSPPRSLLVSHQTPPLLTHRERSLPRAIFSHRARPRSTIDWDKSHDSRNDHRDDYFHPRDGYGCAHEVPDHLVGGSGACRAFIRCYWSRGDVWQLGGWTDACGALYSGSAVAGSLGWTPVSCGGSHVFGWWGWDLGIWVFESEIS